MRRSLLTVSVCALAASLQLAPSLAAASPTPSRRCATISWNGVAALFERWNDALATRDPAQIAAGYARDAQLLPAFANTPRAGRDAIRDYYAALLPLEPKARIVQRTIKLRCNVALDVGVMSLKLTDSGGSESTVPLQYSFVYEYRDGRWQIAHDHASLISDEKQQGGLKPGDLKLGDVKHEEPSPPLSPPPPPTSQ